MCCNAAREDPWLPEVPRLLLRPSGHDQRCRPSQSQSQMATTNNNEKLRMLTAKKRGKLRETNGARVGTLCGALRDACFSLSQKTRIFFLGAFLALAVAQDSLKLDPETKTLVDDLLGSRVTNEDAAEHVFFAGALPAAAERAVAVPVPGDNTGLYIGLTLIPFVLGAVAFVVCLLVFRKQNKAAEGGYQAAMSRGQVIALVAVAVVTSLATLAVGLGLFLGAARSGAVAPAAASTNARAAMEKPSDSAGWLEWLNYYRLAGGSTAVTEERSWSSGILKHLAYLSGTPAAQRAGFSDHSENPSSPLYSKEGAEAGSSSDLG